MKRKILEKCLMCLVLALALAAGRFSYAFAEGESDEAPDNNLYINVYADYDIAYDVITRVNAERKKRGLAALTPDQTLMDAALVRAAENVIYFEHARPNGMKWSSVDPKVMGENLARGSANTKKIMGMWMDSPGHRENILRSRFHSIGVSVVEYDGVYHWVQLFGTSGGAGTEWPESGSVSAPIDLPSAEEGGAFALDYYITLDGEALGAEQSADVRKRSGAKLGLSGDPLVFDPTKVKWTLSDPELAEIDEKGVITPTGKGTGTLYAYSGDIYRAEIDIDTRVDVNNLYIIDSWTCPKVLSSEGPLEPWQDFSYRWQPGEEGEFPKLEIRGINGYKGIFNPVN